MDVAGLVPAWRTDPGTDEKMDYARLSFSGPGKSDIFGTWGML